MYIREAYKSNICDNNISEEICFQIIAQYVCRNVYIILPFIKLEI